MVSAHRTWLVRGLSRHRVVSLYKILSSTLSLSTKVGTSEPLDKSLLSSQVDHQAGA